MSGDGNNPATSGQGFPGQLGLTASNNDFNVQRAIFTQLLSRARFATLVQVNSCTNSGGVSPIGFVNVTPLVSAVDGLFNAYPHRQVNNLCYLRVQGGKNAIIMDPQPGDIGLAVICDRDISVIKNTLKAGPPGSRRRWRLSDGVYCFSCLSPSGAPTQYWQFNASGMSALDLNGNSIVMDSSGIKINGVKFDRSQNVTNIAEATSQSGVKLTQHIHGGVTTGGGNTGLPSG